MHEERDIDAAMSRYAAGDDRAFNVVYDGLAPRLYAYALRRTRDRSRAEDVVQHTLLRMHCNRGQFRDGAHALPWAYAIAHHLLVDGWRHHARGTPDLHGEAPPPADEVLTAAATARQIDDELARMPESQRTAFELLKLEGLSLQEAADCLGISVTAVKLRAHRAYKAIHLALGDIVDTVPHAH